ncbi:hypothetical protein THMIRHAS_15570 [Thiosulfatimonas sediminis]|uniref:DUF5610 domain-containing protein n=1 Tax=Thiosulfatimonas sediminis TaxID=2675054 RepID=A0A6F8PW03_9GAMM|nr:DUF5610 domain-containing protein [Thiosulfatimonas sediminis]BBP46184.1 hypothetical protein THMIRHAS_15570 [Thiosulfatimonas sediminis]
MDIKAFGALSAYQKSADAAQENRGRGVDKSLNLPDQASEQAKLRTATNPAAVKFEQQASLVANLFGNSNNAAQSGLQISFQSAIEEINKQLRIDLGLDKSAADPISNDTLAAQGGMDYWTPENTAQRIVQGSTAFLSGFQKAHPELEGEALVTRFLDVIGQGISDGFSQAKGFLGDLNVLSEGIENTINQTYDLVQEGLTTFKNDYLGITTTSTTSAAELSSNSTIKNEELT